MFRIMFVVIVVAAFQAIAGTDATNSWLTIRPVIVNGTNGMEVIAYYPTSWTSRTLQESSDITSSNYWGGIMLSEQVVPKVNAPGGELPRWSKWIMKSDGVIGPRFFRLIKQ